MDRSMERSNAFREPSEASIRHLSEIEDDPDLDILISSSIFFTDNDVLRSRILEEDQDHEDRPISRSGSFGSQVDSLCSSDSDPKKSTTSSNQEHFMHRKSKSFSGSSGSEVSSFSSRVDSLYKSDPSETYDLMKIEIDNNLKSLELEVINDMEARPKIGVIYSEITCNFEMIMERLEYMSKKGETFTIEDAIEISDLSYIFALLERPEERIVGLPGAMAHEGANLILQAEQLNKKGKILLDRSKSMLQLGKSNILDDHETSLLENEIDNDLRSLRLDADRDLSYYRPIHNEITEMDKKRQAVISFQKETNNDLKFVRVEANIEIDNRRKNGVIYKEFTTNIIEKITERLEYLSKKEERFTIDEAIEIVDATHLLRIFKGSQEENINVTMAGKIAGEGIVSIILAEKVGHNGCILLDQSKSMLSSNLKQNTS